MDVEWRARENHQLGDMQEAQVEERDWRLLWQGFQNLTGGIVLVVIMAGLFVWSLRALF